MDPKKPKLLIQKPTKSVIDWLLASDPAIRWQVMRDLTGESDEAVAAERAKVASEGWGAAILAAQADDGTWAGEVRIPEYPTLRTLLLLCDMGLDPESEQARRALSRVRANVKWLMNITQEELPKDEDISWWHKPFFAGEVEPCMNGRVVKIGAYFGEDMQPLVERLLGEQMADGGWNCEQENGSTRGSFHSTICVLEGLQEYEKATGGSPAVTAARQRGEEYLLERGMLRSLSTGEMPAFDHATEGPPTWTLFSYPTSWHYDVLRGLDYMRSAGVTPDERVAEAIELVAKKQNQNGRWPRENIHDDPVALEMEGASGTDSYWNTLRALRVLDWYSKT
ncbi:MAG: hypothetical protein KIT46_09130 [Anaerolineales bacterium]|nr:hypothetical protein [Anaerolineales bacterium]MCW5856192.1 hypothetical protein [Anaerolineales bacterium]